MDTVVFEDDGDIHAEVEDHFSGAPLGQLVYDRTYARDKADGTKETWPETCRRVARGNVNFVEPWFIEPGEEEAIYELLLNRQMIPAGRHLWVTGVPGRAFTQNCHVAGSETGVIDHAAFTFSELMKGGGVGANYSSSLLAGITSLSPVHVRFISDKEHADYEKFKDLLSEEEHPYREEYLYRIPDSREGWVRSLEMVLEFATRGDEFALVFDVSEIRPEGSPIKGFGGTASGPYALMILLGEVAALTRSNLPFEVAVTPPLLMTIDHLIATAVIAGNVRRSARMSIMHWNDPYIDWFLNCKADHMEHWSTNISVEIDNEFFTGLLDPDSKASLVYRKVIEGMLENGEPGFFNSTYASQGERTKLVSTNPCGEMPLEAWESCNLGHVNLAFGTDSDHRRSFRLMARFLIRATFCDIQDPKQRAVVERNRRIGVGFFGLQEWLALRGIPYSNYAQHGILADALTNWYKVVREEANKYADELKINRPIKVTTIAPTGTIAKLAGTSEGMQPIYAKHYIRRVRYSVNDPEVAKLRARNVPLEPCIYTPGTLVASFPCEDPILTRVPAEYVEEQHEIPLEAALGLQALIQRYYVDNAISMTVNVVPGKIDVEQLGATLRKYLPHLKGVTVFPEASRPQSPIEWISEDTYKELSSTIKDDSINAGESDIMEEACQGGACPIR